MSNEYKYELKGNDGPPPLIVIDPDALSTEQKESLLKWSEGLSNGIHYWSVKRFKPMPVHIAPIRVNLPGLKEYLQMYGSAFMQVGQGDRRYLYDGQWYFCEGDDLYVIDISDLPKEVLRAHYNNEARIQGKTIKDAK